MTIFVQIYDILSSDDMTGLNYYIFCFVGKMSLWQETICTKNSDDNKYIMSNDVESCVVLLSDERLVTKNSDTNCRMTCRDRAKLSRQAVAGAATQAGGRAGRGVRACWAATSGIASQETRSG